MIFEQNTIDFEYYFYNNNGESKTVFTNGECIENIENTIIRSTKCEDLTFYDSSLQQINSISYKNILNDLVLLSREHQKDNLELTVYCKEHFEKICIDKTLEDYRKYGYIRLIVKDNFDDIYYKEVPLFSENEIFHECELGLNFKNLLTALKHKKDFVSHKVWAYVPIVFSQQASGFFIHEVLGHLLEEDVFQYSKEIFMNKTFSPKVTVIDDLRGFENDVGLTKFDDTGVELKPITLVDKGIIKNKISIENENNFGMGRRENYSKKVLPRMRCTKILGYDPLCREEIINKYNDVILLESVFSGSSNFINGSFSIRGYGYYIKNGYIQNFISNMIISGNVIEQLNNIEYVGNDVKVSTTGCVKLGNIIRVGLGGPSISFFSGNVEGDVYNYA